MPVSIPEVGVLVTVATDVLELLHMPPGVPLLVNVVAACWQSSLSPVIIPATGKESTVTVAVSDALPQLFDAISV